MVVVLRITSRKGLLATRASVVGPSMTRWNFGHGFVQGGGKITDGSLNSSVDLNAVLDDIFRPMEHFLISTRRYLPPP